MPVRPLDLLDLPTVYRYRHASLALDITRALTRGDPLGPMGLLAYLNPTRHVYTAVSTHDDQAPLMGSVTHRENDTSARLSFLAPRDDLVTDGLPALLDHLAEQAGKWGAVHVQAEVDELSPVFKTLRRAGFAVYAWHSRRTSRPARSGCEPASAICLPFTICITRSCRPCCNLFKPPRSVYQA
jgi:hypothetical protein